jgi:hypothetical protein
LGNSSTASLSPRSYDPVKVLHRHQNKAQLHLLGASTVAICLAALLFSISSVRAQ